MRFSMGQEDVDVAGGAFSANSLSDLPNEVIRRIVFLSSDPCDLAHLLCAAPAYCDLAWCEKVLHLKHFKIPFSLEKGFIDRLPQIWARAQRVIANYNQLHLLRELRARTEFEWPARFCGSQHGAIWSHVRLFGQADWSCLFPGNVQKLLIGVTTAAGPSQLEGELSVWCSLVRPFSDDRRCCYSMSGQEGELESFLSTGPQLGKSTEHHIQVRWQDDRFKVEVDGLRAPWLRLRLGVIGPSSHAYVSAENVLPTCHECWYLTP